MNQQAIVTVGLGFGDEGKGTVVDALARRHGARLVVRYNGGAQAGHNVITADGVHHTFAQFGSGTLAGADTLLSRYMVVNPIALLNEGECLRQKGWTDTFSMVKVDERALVSTPYHRAVNRILELRRGAQRHGTCGMGVGEAVRHQLMCPEEALLVRDLRDVGETVRKLVAIKRFMAIRLVGLFGVLASDDDEARAAIDKEHSTFNAPLDMILKPYAEFASRVEILQAEEVNTLIRNAEGALLFEGAQGVLLDENYGFHPYTTWSTTTPKNALSILAEGDYTGKVTKLGVTRTHATRHGAGPFPTHSDAMTAQLRDGNNVDGGWQGNFRVGDLDLPLLSYAAQLSGIDALAVTHFSSLVADYWVNTGYLLKNDFVGKTDHYSIPVVASAEDEQAHRNRTAAMFKVECDYQRVPWHSLLNTLEKALAVPVVLTSHGPRSDQKQFLSNWL